MSQSNNNNNNNNNNGKKGLTPRIMVVKSNLSFKQKSRIRNRARITPWCNSSEFDYVGRCLSHATHLFSESSSSSASSARTTTATAAATSIGDTEYDELVYGINRISYWRTRAQNGRLPHSVDMSGSIAELLLQDALQEHEHKEQEQEDNGQNTNANANANANANTNTNTSYQSRSTYATKNSNWNSNALKLSYATTIIRAVNGIADSIQKNRATYGSSVAHLCAQMGLPTWIVDLRHDAAHNELPTLIPLRMACVTLLGFLMEKYWTVLEEFRVGWWEDGERLLVECKSAAKALDRVSSQKEEQESVVSEKDDDDEDEQEEEQDNRNYGVYSIFAEGGSSKKKNSKSKSKSKKSQLQEKEKVVKASKSKAKPKTKPPGRTPRQCMHEYIQTVPMDVGLNMMIQYLIYGGIGDAPEGRGILIPGSPATFPETMSSVRKIRERYSLILLFMASKWPGFVHALFVNVIELMISLDQSTNINTNTNTDTDTDMPTCAGRKRKLYFLQHWIYYLLSNEFYCFLQWHDVIWKGSRNIQQRPRERWTEDLLLHMESGAPLDVLKRVRLPLNSVCDRLLVEGEGECCKEMVRVLEDILAEDRVPLKVARKALIFKRTIEDVHSDPKASLSEKKVCIDSTSDKSSTTLLALEEMEGMLLEEDDKSEPTCIPQIVNDNSKDNGDKIKPWTLCQTWDPCAIGTLPGFA